MGERRYFPSDGLPMGEALDRGLAWLLETVQPEGATVSHHGDSLKVRDNRRLSFVPAGSAHNNVPVIVLDVASPRYRDKARHDEPMCVPLAPDELDRLEALLANRGHRVLGRWNGFPGTSGSLALDARLHPTMQAALDSYRAGCPAHGGSVFCNCGLRREGFARLVPLRAPRDVVLL